MNNIKYNCDFCGKEIEVSPSRLKNVSICCSRECRTEYCKEKSKNCQCSFCGKPIHRKPNEVNKNTNHFCSYKCAGEWNSINFRGKNNHQYGLNGVLNSSYLYDIDFTNYGYLQGKTQNHPFKNTNCSILFHRAIIEEYLRINEPNSPFLIPYGDYNFKFLDKKFHVHHKNFNKTDNRIDNLICLTKAEHQSIHNETKSIIRDDKGRIAGMIDKETNENNIVGKYKKIGRGALNKKYFSDAGLDISSNIDIIIPAKGSALVDTGLFLDIPIGHVGLLWSRSGLSVKHQIEVGAGCLDSSYRGEVKVHLYNYSDTDFQVNIGDRIAQLLTIPINLNMYDEVDSLTDTDRGDGGFGSTGK